MAQSMEEVRKWIKNEQLRIDAYDGKIDQKVTLKTATQTKEATAAYLDYPDLIVSLIDKEKNARLEKIQMKHLLEWFRSIDKKKYLNYNTYLSDVEAIMQVQTYASDRATLVLKSNLQIALRILPFYLEKELAREVIFAASDKYPYLVLRQFGRMVNKPWSQPLLSKISNESPIHLKGYLSSQNKVRMVFNQLKTPAAQTIRRIYARYGSRSKTYLLLDDLINNRCEMEEANQIVLDEEKLFKRLIFLKYKKNVYANQSIEDELRDIGLKTIRKINDLHDKPDAARFRSLAKMDAEMLYTLAIYSEEEIFTSTFLGLYKRLKPKIMQNSNYEFVHYLGLNHLRTWVKMCANFDVLDDFVLRMSPWEKKAMFKHLFEGLSTQNGDLKGAVTLVNTYGSLRNEKNIALFENAVIAASKNENLAPWERDLYDLILHVTQIRPSLVLHEKLKDISISKLNVDKLFTNNEHIQQHFFYDDPDGITSFATFLNTFNHPKWKIIHHKTYVQIKSTSGKAVTIYANRNKYEYEGQKQIQDIFEASGKYPHLVVHRGHSYYAKIAIKTITPSALLVFLGSCGGYNNISKVLSKSPNAHIISSKQVGTYLINNKLSFQLCEWIRLGKDLHWQQFWSAFSKKMSSTPSHNRFLEYISPDKNMGAFFLKAYKKTI
ncbi:MAG: hypothetical protein VXX63_01355 [Bacteroidota bacterium]|nr:hypothetical protein [Bacteroidota bacterium]